MCGCIKLLKLNANQLLEVVQICVRLYITLKTERQSAVRGGTDIKRWLLDAAVVFNVCLPASDLRGLPMFAAIDWDRLQDAEMPFVPEPDDAQDTCYFDG